MADITYRSTMSVELIQQVGSDPMVVAAARVSTADAISELSPWFPVGDAKLIEYLMRNRHASPFEHGSMTVLVEAPIFVAREWMRHRTMSYNETSGRYRELNPEFYIPGDDRPMRQEGKPGEYRFTADGMLTTVAQTGTMHLNELCWLEYQSQLKSGVAKEVARMVLPVNIFTQFYATANPRNWLNFLSLRTISSEAAIPSTPMYEIENCAEQVENIFKLYWPITYSNWNHYGRTSL